MTDLTSASQIETQKDFYDFVLALAKEASSIDRTLEEYLRSLWSHIQENKESQVSFSLLAEILRKALINPIALFDESWLKYENPPVELGTDKPVDNSFNFLEKMLLYQIADLHRMRKEGVLDQPPNVLWLGVSREGGNTWYNFTPSTFLECALGGFRSDTESTECDWDFLAIFLWLGQIYE